MKSFLKYTYIAGFSLLLTVTAACKKDFLDQKPGGVELSEDFFATPDGALRATNAVYNQLRNWSVHVFSFVGIASITSDDADKGSSPGDTGSDKDQLDNFTFSASSGSFDDFWIGYYQGIARANQVIERIPAIEMDEALKARYIAESKFLRAYFYFNLARTFGGVPLIATVPAADGSDPVMPRATTQATYEFIIKDLNDAIAVLPERSGYSAVNMGRATKGAAKGLLAKVYMYQKNWTEVLRLTGEIMSSNEYDLNTPYDKIWTKEGNNTKESLFEVQTAVLSQGGGGSQYSEIQSVRGTNISVGGWGFNTPSQSLVNTYEPNDPRLKATIIQRGDTMPDGQVIPNTAENTYYNKKAYVMPDERSPKGMGDAAKNIKILRYADVVLMHAEAANELGNGTAAAIDVNAVRFRARGFVASTPNGLLPNVAFTNKDAFRNVIWQERHVELAMENDRYWDIVRQGRAGSILRALGKNFKDGINEVMPIPQNQIDNTGGVLTQNSGY